VLLSGTLKTTMNTHKIFKSILAAIANKSSAAAVFFAAAYPSLRRWQSLASSLGYLSSSSVMKLNRLASISFFNRGSWVSFGRRR
jgi:hypothetical protein